MVIGAVLLKRPMALMFASRIGPLTLGVFLATRTRPRVRYSKSPVCLR